MLFYSVVIIALAVTSLATPPPGYVKKPDNDKNPPAYEYKYEIRDDNGKGQGKAETRAGEFASGNYYVNTDQAATDVKYFADDWGYHPVVKYGSTDKHSSTTTRFASGEYAVKALHNGGDVGPKVKLPLESQKRKQVQIIQPYTIGDEDPPDVTPTYPTIVSDGRDASKVDEAAEDSREYPSSGEIFPKESRGSSTILIPSPSHSTTSQEIAYTASTPPTLLTYAPLQEVRDIYANNDYQNAALIDEQLFLQSAAGNFGQKLHAASVGESGIKNFEFSTITSPPEVISPTYSLTKQNGDVTYTVHSGSNVNTAYLSSSVKSKKIQRLQDRYRYRQKFVSSSTTESPNYSGNSLSSVIFASSTSAPAATASGEFTSNDLVSEKQEKYEYVSLDAKPSQEFSEFGPADPRLVNYGLAHGNEGHNRHQGKLETPGLSAYSTGNNLQNENEDKSSTLDAYSAISPTVSSATFAKPIVVAEITPGYNQPKYSTTCGCADDLVAPTTPSSVFSTTSQPIISTEIIGVTPKYPNQNHITTSSVILNPIQAGVALVNAGETHLISQEGKESSVVVKENVFENSVSSVENSHERNGLNLEEKIRQIQEQQREHENRVYEEEQLEKVKQLQEKIQLQEAQQFQQELQLQQNQYEIQGLQLEQQRQFEALQQQQEIQHEGDKQLLEQQKYNYKQLSDDAQLQQEVELQQVEESQQNEQLQHQQQQQEVEIQQVHELQLEEDQQFQDAHTDQQQREDINLQQVREETRDYEVRNIQEGIEDQKAQQLQQQLKQLQKYQEDQERHQTSNTFVTGSLESAHHDSGIEIQKSIEIYHNEPVHEIHYPAQVPSAQVESLKIDQSQGQQQYIELQSIENTQQAYKGQIDQSGGKVSSDINQVINKQAYDQLGQTKDQFSLAAENQARQVLLADHQANLNQAYDLNRLNSISQQSAISNGAVLLGFGINHGSSERQNYQIDQHRELGIGVHGIDQLPIPQRLIFGSNIANGGYQLNQRDQSHSHSYESNRGQQQVVVGLPYTLEASKELVFPDVQTTSTQIIENPIFEKHIGGEGINSGEKYAVESSNESSIGRLVEQHIPVIKPVEKWIEKTVHVPQPYTVEKVIERKVPYPVDRIVEKHVPILQPYPVHIKVPQPYPVEKIIPKPYPVETIVEKPIHIHVPVEKIIEKKIPVPQPYPVEVEKIVEKKVPYPVEVTKYIDKPITIHVPRPYPVEKIVEKTVHVPQPYPVEKIVERIVEKPIHIRIPYAVEVVRNIPYGVQYGVSYQQIMRPHSHNLYINHGKTRTPFYGLPVITRHQEFRHQENGHGIDSKLQFQGYSYDKPSISFVEGGNGNDQITAGNQQIQFQHSNSFNLAKKSNSHVVFPHYSSRRHAIRATGKDKPRNEEYIGPVPPQRSLPLRHHQHILQNQHAGQARSPQSSTAATRSPTSSTTILRRAREPETKPQSSVGNFRQSRVEYGFKPPMIPSVQYDEETSSKVES